MYSALLQKICLKKDEVGGKISSNKIIVRLVTQGLLFFWSLILLRKFTMEFLQSLLKSHFEGKSTVVL